MKSIVLAAAITPSKRRPSFALATCVGALVLALGLTALPVSAQAFKFSEVEKTERAERDATEAQRTAKLQAQLSTPCRDSLKNERIVIMVGIEKSGVMDARQAGYGPQIQAISQRIKSIGLRVLTPEEVKRQIAQAEIDAFFKGNTDAALSASKRMQAKYTLKGVVQTQTSVNPMIQVNQVSVNLIFQLTGDNGRFSSDFSKSGMSAAGTDTNATALELINRYTDEAVAQLYADYCQRAGIGRN